MNKEWCDKAEQDNKECFYTSKENAICFLKRLLEISVAIGDEFRVEFARNLLDEVERAKYEGVNCFCTTGLSLCLFDEEDQETSRYDKGLQEKWNDLSKKAVKAVEDIEDTNTDIRYVFEDVEREVCGDIIITDPCYFDSAENGFDRYADNDKSYFDVKGMLCKTNQYGDWSCHTFDDKGNVLGEFCADAGMVCVVPLKNVLEYNPKFNYHVTKPWTTTWIKDFKGKVGIYVEEEKDYPGEFFVYVAGEGVNMKTKTPIKFITRQTGL